jgi:hypothetical protein
MTDHARTDQFAFGLRLGEPGSGGKDAVASCIEGISLPAALRTLSDWSDRAISVKRRKVAGVLWAAIA